MKKAHYEIRIDAPRQVVWDTMLSPATYTEWTAPFCEGSYFEGAWTQGSRIRFLAPNGEGMVAEIAESRAPEFVSVRHLGTVKDGMEDTESDEVKQFTPAYENYTFSADGAGTHLAIDMDVMDAYAAMFDEMWPKSLARLKAIAEKAAGTA